MPKQLIVQYSPIRSSLVNLPPLWVNALLDQNKLPQNVILEISWSTRPNDTKKTYCGWSGEASKPMPPNSVFTNGNSKLDVLEIDPQLGTAIGLAEGQSITVEFCRNVADCASVHVEPNSEDDWEILELHAGYVEENLLSQIRVVYTDQIMCVWIHGRTLVRLKVVELDPKHTFVKLSNQSEVIVAPKVRRTKEDVTAANQQLQKQQQQSAPFVHLRTMPLEEIGIALVLVHPSINLGPLVRISKIIPGYARRDGQDKKESGEVVTQCKAMYCAVTPSNTVPLGHVSLDVSVRNTLGITDFDVVKVSSVVSKKITPTALAVRCLSSTANTHTSIKLGLDSAANSYQAKQKAAKDCLLIDSLRNLLCSKDQIVLTHNMTINLPSKGQSVMLQFGQKRSIFSAASQETSSAPLEINSAEQYSVMTKSQLQNLTVEIGEDIPRTHDEPKNRAPPLSLSLGGVQKVFHRLLRHTLASVAEKELKDALGVPGSGGILITGAHGAGKTSLAKKLIHTLKTDRRALIYTLEVNCAEIADERVPTFKDMLQTWLDKAAWHAPSVIFLDDLDRLIPAEVEHADSSRSKHLAELFIRTALTKVKRHAIMLIATSQQQQSVHPALITNHVFSELQHLNPPSRDERKEVLQAIMAEGPEVMVKGLEHIDLVSVASETEGFLAADLKALIERSVHEGAVRSIKQRMDIQRGISADASTDISTEGQPTLELSQQDFSKAREGFVPSSLRGVKLQNSSTVWSDIGGLNETRKTLLETLEWPTKYAAVFSQCPLRLRSGLLLYGYPGCGKTLLASAVAKECGLNFISVKGPEILNKYIGASEKSVRDLFERAQAAKPCVLFFDEFDSIAPRRGHDSTGVTDRVVNQMLTQMDGAEGLDGVYVLAATSRPDLIDPALLRPGRLDKALLCGMPQLGERLEILNALARKMTLAPDVDLHVFAEKTEGYSGADLQGFLYNAHLEAIHGAIQIDSFRTAQTEASNGHNETTGTTEFVLMDRSDATKAPLTSAERAQIAQRLAMIKKGSTTQSQEVLEGKDEEQEQNGKRKEEKGPSDASQTNTAAFITNEYLQKSLSATRASITADERLRLQMIYDEFVTGRTGELPSGEGAKGVGKRSTLG